MEAPKKIQVLGETIPVTYAENLGRFDAGYRVSGDYKSKRIRLVKGMTEFNERATLLHEMIHYLWERAGLHHHLSSKTEELILAALDSWLLTALRDNPDLRDYLFEEGVGGG